jgi:host factor-I protein
VALSCATVFLWVQRKKPHLVYNSDMVFSDSFSSQQKSKSPPPETTNEEAAHLKSLVEKKKPVSIKLVDGEVVNGWIEYYDRNMLRLTREGKPNLFIFKNQIAYVSE